MTLPPLQFVDVPMDQVLAQQALSQRSARDCDRPEIFDSPARYDLATSIACALETGANRAVWPARMDALPDQIECPACKLPSASPEVERVA